MDGLNFAAGRLGSVSHIQQKGHRRETAATATTTATANDDESYEQRLGIRGQEAGESGVSAAGCGSPHSPERLRVLRHVGLCAEAAHGLELLGARGVAGVHLRGAERAQVEGVGEGPRF